jgi:hypothetical protein
MKITYDALLDELRDLRQQRDKADAVFLIRLLDVERQHMDVIRAAGCQSFAQFLKSNALTDPARYENFKAGLEKVKDENLAEEIGSEAVIVASQLTTPKMAPKFVKAITAWRDDEKHAGMRPSQETAKHILLQVDPREEEPEAVRRQSELARLREENKRLRAENAKLKARIAALENKNRPQPRA